VTREAQGLAQAAAENSAAEVGKKEKRSIARRGDPEDKTDKFQ